MSGLRKIVAMTRAYAASQALIVACDDGTIWYREAAFSEWRTFGTRFPNAPDPSPTPSPVTREEVLGALHAELGCYYVTHCPEDTCFCCRAAHAVMALLARKGGAS